VLARDPARDAEHDLQPGFDLLAARDAAIAPIAAELRARDAAGVRRMAASLAHMHGNRLLRGSERAQEMVLYDFLKRLHASRRARASGAARDEARR
jgi:thiopeptide-type bacteriocin biosynthesis protein